MSIDWTQKIKAILKPKPVPAWKQLLEFERDVAEKNWAYWAPNWVAMHRKNLEMAVLRTLDEPEESTDEEI